MAILLSALMFCAWRASAMPELVRAGYFACTSCHVSPGGGGTLTAYGHGIAGERLSTWGGASQELPEWLVLGADARSAVVGVEDGGGQTVRKIRMQDDAAVGLVLPHLTAVVQGGILGQSERAPEAAGKPALRQYYAMASLGPVTLRAGRFMPRYGLNIPEHAANTRRGLGFDEGQENHAAELGLLTESDELSLTYMDGVTPNGAEPTGSLERGATASWYHYLLGRHRVGVSALYGVTGEVKRALYGVSAVLALPGSAFALAEGDVQTTALGTETTRSGFCRARVAFEPWQGVVPFLDGESTTPDLADGRQRSEAYSVGLQLYPFAHVDLEAAVGPRLDLGTHSFVTAAYGVVHYYF